MVNPTGYTALDVIGFTDKGDYDPDENYVKNDLVHLNGSTWRCKIDDTIGITPTEGANWTLFIGEPTNLVERIIAPVESNPATAARSIGNQIIYNDYLWEVIDDIAIGDTLIDYDIDPTNANIKKAAPVETQLLTLKSNVGNLADLNTSDKSNAVNAINENKAAIDSIIQESVFTTAEVDGQFHLYWHGAAGSCPYSVTQSGVDYHLNFTYTT